MEPSGTKWNQVEPSGTKWNEVEPSGTCLFSTQTSMSMQLNIFGCTAKNLFSVLSDIFLSISMRVWLRCFDPISQGLLVHTTTVTGWVVGLKENQQQRCWFPRNLMLSSSFAFSPSQNLTALPAPITSACAPAPTITITTQHLFLLVFTNLLLCIVCFIDNILSLERAVSLVRVNGLDQLRFLMGTPPERISQSDTHEYPRDRQTV